MGAVITDCLEHVPHIFSSSFHFQYSFCLSCILNLFNNQPFLPPFSIISEIYAVLLSFCLFPHKLLFTEATKEQCCTEYENNEEDINLSVIKQTFRNTIKCYTEPLSLTFTVLEKFPKQLSECTQKSPQYSFQFLIKNCVSSSIDIQDTF